MVATIDSASTKKVVLWDIANDQVASGIPTFDAKLVPKGVKSVTMSGAAQTLAQLWGAVTPAGSRLVYIEPEVTDIKFTDDGTTPTATNGMRIYASVAWPYNGDLTAIKLIPVSGTPVVNLAFYG